MTEPIPVHWASDCKNKHADEGWPHIHLWRETDADAPGRVTGRVLHWNGDGGAWSSDERRALEARSFHVNPPSRLARAFGDTTQRRVDRAVVRLQGRWERIVRLNDEAARVR